MVAPDQAGWWKNEGKDLISWRDFLQTKYKVYVSNLTSPKLIVFSSTFHPGWKLNGESSIPVYGFLNGFRVEKEGEYILEFEPQKWVYPGLILSLITFLGLVVTSL